MDYLDRAKVKDYFMGKSQLGPIITIILGILTIAIGIGIFIIIGGIIWFFVNKFSADTKGEAEVDRVREAEIQMAKKRAMEKLNIIDEQIQNVEPVVVSGRGFEPDSPTAQTIAATGKLAGTFKRSLIKDSDDPVLMTRIGSDNKFRSSLVSITVFMFGEKQLYIYFSNVDLTTGLVYSEGTHEYFYSDINSLSFLQSREKVFNYKTKKFERILFECVKIFASGCHYTAHLSTDLERSIIETKFAGMRTLIRDRKNIN